MNPSHHNADEVSGQGGSPDANADGQSPASRREHPEPHSRHEPIPGSLAALCIALGLLAGSYLAVNLSRPDAPAQGAANLSSPADPQLLGRRVFSQTCAACHQPGGLGIPGLFPPLAGSEWVLGSTWCGDNHLVTILLHGVQGPIDVGGKSYNNSMPAWINLDDKQIAAVLNHVRSEWGNSAPAISPEFVQEIRKQSAGRRNPWSQKELRAIAPQKSERLPLASPSPGANRKQESDTRQSIQALRIVAPDAGREAKMAASMPVLAL